jgi:RNA polymerase sigma-70 factor (ECF subfamily)
VTADRTAVFEAERARLTGLGYRMLGSQAEAEDVVQDAWIRWQRVEEPIANPAAWLTTVTSRLALDRLRSARAQRESYPGPWLPEPLSADPGPADHAELADSITFGFLTVLERLGPVERVVFLLAEVFDVPLAEVAEVVGRSPDATRQIASRARKRMRDDRTRFAANDESAWQTTLAFLAAAQDGDLDGLIELLSADAVLISDGGPDRHAARRPVVGPERIARFVANVTKRMAPDSVSQMAEVNGVPGLVVRQGFDGPAEFALAIECDEHSIHHLYVVINPDKLQHL